MIKIAFLGSDSTHTEALGGRINGPQAPFRDAACVVSLWGQDAAEAKRKAGELGIARVASTPEQALDGVDLAMVIGRFGESHYEPARVALGRGIATFVDKPFTVSVAEARKLAELARAQDVPLSSSSPLRFARELDALKKHLAAEGGDWVGAVATVPANCADLGSDPRFDSAFFYGIHGVEMLFELVGHDVRATRVDFGRSAIAALLEMPGGRTASVQLVRGAAEFYALDLYTRKASYRAAVELDGSYYDGMLRYVLEFAAGKCAIALESTLRAIELLEAIETRDSFKRRAA
jgi:predicted dehydrogenase